MNITNTDDEYGLVAKSFHWLIAVMILALLPIGLFMGGMENSPFKFQVFAMHKSFGLLVFFLGLLRLVWRLFISPVPDHMENHKHWEVMLARAAHFWLYVCIIGMPLSGWLMSSAGEYPVPFFGIPMPALMGKDENLGHLFKETHEILGYTLMFILALHIAGALKHHIMDGDETLQRMTSLRRNWFITALVVTLAAASYGAIAAISIFGEEEDEPRPAITSQQDRGTQTSVMDEAANKAVDTSKLPEHGWAIVPANSHLTFQAVLYKEPFTGTLKNFSGTIVFNPDDLSSAFADIVIDMAQVDSGDDNRDTNMLGADWFNVEAFPQSHFVTKSFEKAGDNSYVAVGDLTLRGVTMPLAVPFTLEIKDKTAHMKAEFSLNRSTFGVGQGQWQADDTVGQDVKVMLDLTAVQ